MRSADSDELQDWDRIERDAAQGSGDHGQHLHNVRATHKNVIALVKLRKSIDGVSRNTGAAVSAVIDGLASTRSTIDSALGALRSTIDNFNESTTHLTGQANRLIGVYVVLTAVIALGAMTQLFTQMRDLSDLYRFGTYVAILMVGFVLGFILRGKR